MATQSEKQRLAQFFRAEYRKLLGFVRRRVDEIAAQDAEDFVQDVALQLFDHADVAFPIEYLSAYVYRSLQNRITDYFRKRRSALARGELKQDLEPQSLPRVVEEGGYDPAPEIRQMEIVHDLSRLLDGLSEEERRLIVAVDIQGHTLEHLSRMWGVPVNTLLSRRSRALKKVQRQIQNERETKE